MSIVIITIPGEAQRTFVNSLHKKTKGGIELVVIQKSKLASRSRLKRINDFLSKTKNKNLIKELWYALLLKSKREVREALDYFRKYSALRKTSSTYIPNTLETSSVNSEEVCKILEKISPELIVIWGNTVVEPRILKTAKKAINLHMGLCPHFHGAVANQNAVILKQPQRIGATIHYAVEQVDAGDIIAIIKANPSKLPKVLFRDLNDRARKQYLDIAYRLYLGEEIPGIPQDTSLSKNLLLKDWTRETRYKLGKQILNWEKTGVLE